MKNLSVSLIQPFVSANNSMNFKNMELFIEEASKKEADIICLPERWYFLDFSKKVDGLFQEEHGLQYQFISQWSKEYQVPILSGAIWEKSNITAEPRISSYYFSSSGKEQFRQDKIHLYGAEKDFVKSGNKLVVFNDSKLKCKFSILICFDLNISSHLTRMAVENGSEIIFSPTLIRDTGMKNWEIYIQARALENRVPVISCNSIFEYYGRNFIGDSKIIHFTSNSSSPVDLMCESAGLSPCIMNRQINLSYSNEIRSERLNENAFPMGIDVLNLSS